MKCSKKQGLQARRPPENNPLGIHITGTPLFSRMFGTAASDITETAIWHQQLERVCVGMGHRESSSQVSMAGFCNLSSSTKLGWVGVGGISIFNLEVRICLHILDPWVRKIPWRRAWQPTPVSLPGQFHGQGSLVGYSPWGCEESDRTKAT